MAAILRFVGRPPVREMALSSFPLTAKSPLVPTTLWTVGKPSRSASVQVLRRSITKMKAPHEEGALRP
jgi:hypothetical protein